MRTPVFLCQIPHFVCSPSSTTTSTLWDLCGTKAYHFLHQKKWSPVNIIQAAIMFQFKRNRQNKLVLHKRDFWETGFNETLVTDYLFGSEICFFSDVKDMSPICPAAAVWTLPLCSSGIFLPCKDLIFFHLQQRKPRIWLPAKILLFYFSLFLPQVLQVSSQLFKCIQHWIPKNPPQQ